MYTLSETEILGRVINDNRMILSLSLSLCLSVCLCVCVRVHNDNDRKIPATNQSMQRYINSELQLTTTDHPCTNRQPSVKWQSINALRFVKSRILFILGET